MTRFLLFPARWAIPEKKANRAEMEGVGGST